MWRWTALWASVLVLMLATRAWAAEPQVATIPTVTLLTLDDRPANTLLIQQLAAIAGVTLRLTTDAEAAPTADLVSLNAAAFGSLVASRSGDPTTLRPPELRADALVHFAVPRVQPFVKDPETLARYTAAMEALKKVEVQEQVLAAIAGTGLAPTDAALADYAHRMRAWLRYLDLAAVDPDRLLISLDDNRPGPLSAWLKLRLGAYSRHVHDGTDEGMMLLLARWLRERQTGSRPVEMGVLWTAPAALLNIQAFESGMPVENLLRMADWLHLRLTSRTDHLPAWRPLLWMHGGQATAEEIAQAAAGAQGRPVVVADFAGDVNKGDATLFTAWAANGVPEEIVGYVGWNTTSNTVGTAVALWAAIDHGYSERADPEAVRGGIELFLWARILDDYLYMAQVRPERQEALKAEGQPIQGMSAALVAAEAERLQFALLERWAPLRLAFAPVFEQVD
ncbi:MAG TPA: DUF4127 family protein, partial [bacterium]|nr:DUF4127 family protein [bacterium]